METINLVQRSICTTIQSKFPELFSTIKTIEGKVVNVIGSCVPYTIDVAIVIYDTDIIAVSSKNNTPLPIIAEIPVDGIDVFGLLRIGDIVRIGFVDGNEGQPYFIGLKLNG